MMPQGFQNGITSFTAGFEQFHTQVTPGKFRKIKNKKVKPQIIDQTIAAVLLAPMHNIQVKNAETIISVILPGMYELLAPMFSIYMTQN